MEITSSQYYDENYNAYVQGWSSDHFHMGFWEDDTETHEESLLNTVLSVVDELNIEDQDRILDAGAGVGGACRFIASNFNTKIIGITLSDVLLNEAKKKTDHQNLNGNVEYYNMNYLQTDFENQSFDSVFGIESICYAENKLEFLEEAYRILKTGGRICVADGFLLKDNLESKEQNKLEKVLKGWVLPNLSTVQGFENQLKRAGYTDIKFKDKSKEVNKSSLKMYKTTRLTRIPIYLLWKLGIFPESRFHSSNAGYHQRYLVKNDVLGYGVFSATKPNSDKVN